MHLIRFSFYRLRAVRGSGSPVLAATGFVNGEGHFSTPTDSTPLNRSPKIVTGDYVGDPLQLCKLGAHPSTGDFWANGWNITKIFIYTPFGNSPTGKRPVDGFSRIMAQTTRTRARMCLLVICSHGSPIRGPNPPNPKFPTVTNLKF